MSAPSILERLLAHLPPGTHLSVAEIQSLLHAPAASSILELLLAHLPPGTHLSVTEIQSLLHVSTLSGSLQPPIAVISPSTDPHGAMPSPPPNDLVPDAHDSTDIPPMETGDVEEIEVEDKMEEMDSRIGEEGTRQKNTIRSILAGKSEGKFRKPEEFANRDARSFEIYSENARLEFQKMLEAHSKVGREEFTADSKMPLGVTPIVLGEFKAFGTGAIIRHYNTPLEERLVWPWDTRWEDYIVTAKHVIWNDAEERFHDDLVHFWLPYGDQERPRLKRRRLTLSMTASYWCEHPTHDLIAFPILKNVREKKFMAEGGEWCQIRAGHWNVYPSDKRRIAWRPSKLFQMGYPKGLTDEYLCPVLRRAEPCFPIEFDRHVDGWDGALDTTIYPGTSGGPVIIKQKIKRPPWPEPPQFSLNVLGILTRGPHAPVDPTDGRENATRGFLNIGQYVLTERLRDPGFLDLDSDGELPGPQLDGLAVFGGVYESDEIKLTR